MHLQVHGILLKIKFADFLKFTQRYTFQYTSINVLELNQNIDEIPAITETAQPHSCSNSNASAANQTTFAYLSESGTCAMLVPMVLYQQETKLA
jgi:hypothetical protein